MQEMAGTGDDPRHVMMNCENHTNDNNLLLFLVENIIRCFPSHVSGPQAIYDGTIDFRCSIQLLLFSLFMVKV